MTAHPPRTRWHVETYDPLAAKWSGTLPLPTSQAAIAKRAHLDRTQPAWPDGTTCERRIVLETTSFLDLSTDPGLPRFPKGGFILTDHANQDFAAIPDRTPDGRPAIRLAVGSHEIGHAESTVPLDQLEEVIAGLRDVARQQGGQSTPTRRRLTEGEHDAAWHAIEGAAGEDGADPGTVLAAVLRALGIDPPGAAALRIHPGHPAAADRILDLLRDVARRASQMTQNEFGLAPGGPSPTAPFEAGEAPC